MVPVMGIRHKNQYGYVEYVDRLPVPDCCCNKCLNAASRQAARDAERAARQQNRPNKHERQAPPGGGTFNSTVYQTSQKPDGSTHYGFNSGSVDGAWHGHVIEESDGSYRYARDADGTEYNV